MGEKYQKDFWALQIKCGCNDGVLVEKVFKRPETNGLVQLF